MTLDLPAQERRPPPAPSPPLGSYFNRKRISAARRGLIRAIKTILERSLYASEAQESGLQIAHRGDGKRFVVRADEKLTAFVELAAYWAKPYITIRCRPTRQIRTAWRTRPAPTKKILNQARAPSPARFFRLLQTCNRRINTAGKQKGSIYEPIDSAKKSNSDPKTKRHEWNVTTAPIPVAPYKCRIVLRVQSSGSSWHLVLRAAPTKAKPRKQRKAAQKI